MSRKKVQGRQCDCGKVYRYDVVKCGCMRLMVDMKSQQKPQEKAA